MACGVTFPGLTNLSRPHALLLVALAWAAIYLPALGSLEIKGEEGRRLLPAVSMLETGRWIVPSVGGVPYLSKPPLINWLAAWSFRLAGNRGEWAARAPSALAVLALALVAAGSLSAWLTPAGAMLAAIFLLTNIGLMEKGRLAEIEALYLSLYGIALLLWLGAWRREADTPGARPTWRAWTLPWVFLGLGLLTKGPLHLVFFYVVVLAVLWCAGRVRDLWNWPHLAGDRVDAGDFRGVERALFGTGRRPPRGRRVAGAVPEPAGGQRGFPFQALGVEHPARTGKFPAVGGDGAIVVAARGGGRGGDGGPGGSTRRTVRGDGVFPGREPRAGRAAEIHDAADRARVRVAGVGAERCVARVAAHRVGAGGVCLRRTGNHWLTGVALISGGGRWRWALVVLAVIVLSQFLERIHRWQSPAALGLASAVVMALLTADFAIGAVPRFRRAEIMRPMGAEIEAAVPPDEPLAVLRPGFLPYLYYLRPGLVYVQRIGDLPILVHYVLVRQDDLPNVETTLQERRDTYRIDLRVRDKRLKNDPRSRWLLLRLNPLPEPSL